MLDIILSRRSVRKWKTDLVAEGDILDILKAAMHAPSAGNEQAWQFIILTGKKLEEYLMINKNVPAGAPAGILICGDLKLQKYQGYYTYDCAAATQNILLAVHSKGLGAVWTAVFPDSVAKVQTLLELPDHVIPFSFVPIGYPDVLPEKTINRYDESRVHRNKW